MSVTAARLLLDRLVSRGLEMVLVLHDFDISGFSIFGTLGTNSDRYTFRNKVPIIDTGLRLTDVEELGLLSERFTSNKDDDAVAETLARHGATPAEIDFLIRNSSPFGFEGERIELNAMTSEQFIKFIERKFEEHGVSKVVPESEVLERHARRMLERHIVMRTLDKLRPRIRERVAEIKLPDDLRERVEQTLEETPQLPWEAAIAEMIEDEALDDLDDGEP
jgi:hypothetical protein